MIKAKRSTAAQDLSKLLRGMHLTRDFELAGHKWRIRTLEPAETIEADGLVSDISSMQAGRSYARATLAYAITHIDEEPIEKHFAWPDRPATAGDEQAEWDAISSNPDALRKWYRLQVYDYIVHDMQDEVISEMFAQYAKLANDKRSAVESLPGFSKKTPTSTSSPT